MEVVRAAWEFAAAHDVPVCGFLEEECVTHKMHPELEELHHRRVQCVCVLWQAVCLRGWRSCTIGGAAAAVAGNVSQGWRSCSTGGAAAAVPGDMSQGKEELRHRWAAACQQGMLGAACGRRPAARELPHGGAGGRVGAARHRW